jgi:hypothetical protein
MGQVVPVRRLLSARPARGSSDGDAPIVLTCPVPLPGDLAPETGQLSDPALDELIGLSRSMLLSVIAAGPGRAPGNSPAAPGSPRLGQRPRPDPAPGRACRHQPDGARKAHRLTLLGWTLLLRSAGPA